jgi:hypothetical protein
MRVVVRRIFDERGIETGSILTAVIEQPTTLQQKYAIENALIQHAFNNLYPREGLNIYRDMYEDTPSVTIVRRINDLPQHVVNVIM